MGIERLAHVHQFPEKPQVLRSDPYTPSQAGGTEVVADRQIADLG